MDKLPNEMFDLDWKILSLWHCHQVCSILGEMEDMRMFEESQEDDEENPHEISLEVLSIC